MTKSAARVVTPFIRREICTYWAQGWSCRQISEELGINFHTIRKWVRILRDEGAILRRGQKASDQFAPEEDIRALQAELYGVPDNFARWVLAYRRMNRVTAASRVEALSLAALWRAQKGKCYYTGAPMVISPSMFVQERQERKLESFLLKEAQSVQAPVLVSTVGTGEVFVTVAAARLRGGYSHEQFLRLVRSVCRHMS